MERIDCSHYETCRYNKHCPEDCNTFFPSKSVPPYYIGQPAWILKTFYRDTKNWELLPLKVSMLQQKADGTWRVRLGSGYDYPAAWEGIDFFMSFEAAEVEFNRRIEEHNKQLSEEQDV